MIARLLASRLLPVPLMSRAGRAQNPPLEDQGPEGFKFFCPGAGRPKVGGRCTLFWWIGRSSDAKSLIVEQKFLTKSVKTSIKLPVSSIKLPVSSISRFSAFSLSSLSFSFVNKEEEEKKASTKRGRQSINSAGCLFFHPSVALRFSHIWWMVMDGKLQLFNGLRCDPSISTNPPVFSPSPPEEVFL